MTNNIVHLAGTELTPTVILHQALSSVDDIESVTISIVRKSDGGFFHYHSDMKHPIMAMMAMSFMEKVSWLLFRSPR